MRKRLCLILTILAVLFLSANSYAEESWTKVPDMTKAKMHGASVILNDGRVLIVDPREQNAEIYNANTNSWSEVPNLTQQRSGATMILLSNGKVMLIGGYNFEDYLKTTVIYDPNTNSWSNGPSMSVARSNAAVVTLDDDRVLVMGGSCFYYSGEDKISTYTNTTEIYNPKTNTWTVGPTLNRSRVGSSSAVVLPGGKILIVGNGSIVDGNTTEIYDPKTNRWSFGPSMKEQRMEPNAVLMKNGKVLVIGGSIYNGDKKSVEIYDPYTNSWSLGPSLHNERTEPTVTTLQDGRVLVAGGSYYKEDGTSPMGGEPQKTTGIYNPDTNSWSEGPSMNNERAFAVASLLDDGKVLVAGGFMAQYSAEVYNTETNVTIADVLDFLHSKGLLQGDNGDLMLDKNLTREQMIVITSRLLGYEDEAKNYSTKDMVFEDISKNNWAAPYIAWAKEKGITQGYSASEFGYGKSLTVWQTMAFIERTLGFNEPNEYTVIDKAKSLGILNGSKYDSKDLNYNEAITRGDMALLLYNTLYAIGADGKVLGEKLNVFENGLTYGEHFRVGDWIYFSNDSENGYLFKINIDGTGRKKLNNYSNSKIIAIDNDWIYYNITTDEKSEYFRIRTDGNDNMKLNSWTEKVIINVIDDWVYYYDLDEQKGKLTVNVCKEKIDGSSKMKLASNFAGVTIKDNKVYYKDDKGTDNKDDDCLEIMNLDGSEKHLIEKGNIVWFEIIDNNMYYQLEDGIYKANIEGTEKNKLTSNKGYVFASKDDWIYYYEEMKNGNEVIFRVKSDGTQVSKIIECNIYESKPILVDDWIYYENPSYNGNLYKVKNDGTVIQKISDDSISDFKIEGNWIYCKSCEGDVFLVFSISFFKMKLDGSEKTKPLKFYNSSSTGLFE